MAFLLNLLIILSTQAMLFIINMIMARHAGAVLFGDYTVATNSLLLLAAFVTLGTDSIIAHYVPKLYIKRKYHEIKGLLAAIQRFLAPIYTLMIVFGLLLTFTIITVNYFINRAPLFGISHPLTFFLWGSVGIATCNIYLQLLRAINFFRTAILINFLQTVFYFGLALIIYFYFYPLIFHENKRYFAHAMLFGFILSYFLAVGLFMIVRHKSHFQFDQKSLPIVDYPLSWKNKIYGYTLQNLNRYIFMTIPLLVLEIIGKNDYAAGLFAAIISIMTIAYTAIGPLGTFISPNISAAYAQSKRTLKKTVNRFLVVCFVVSLITALLLGAMAKHMLLLYQSNFIYVLPYTYICLITVVTYGISTPLSRAILFSYNGSQITAQLTLALLVIQFVASVIMVHWFGLLGAIICYIGINFLDLAIKIVLMRRIYHYDPFGNKAI